MRPSNVQIAAVLEEFADLLEIAGANPFRIRAYRNAARSVGELGTAVASMVDEGKDLTSLPGIGEDLAAKVKTLVATGALPDLEGIYQKVPRTVTELLDLPGLGPKRVRTLFQSLGIASIQELEQAAAEGRIHSLPGMGKKTEQKLLESIRSRGQQAKRFLRSDVQAQADRLLPQLIQCDPEARLAVAGSFRRGRDTIGDLDILAASESPARLMEALPRADGVRDVLAHGPAKTSVRLDTGLQVDLRVVDRRSFGAALHYFTGSQAHNIALRREAQKRGLLVNEYGVFRGDEWIAGATEEEVFRAVDLPWIPPELREDRGELETAREGALPDLVSIQHIRGDLHCHTIASDGRNTLEEMVAAARARGLCYLAITDHSQSLTVANGLNEDRLLRQIDQIDALNDTLDGFTVLRGIEVDILEDGRLDLPDRVLGRLDLVVASVHSKFNLSRDAQTERILRAMDNRHFSILAHPTGRRLPDRPSYAVDLERVIEHARSRPCFLECNSNPRRLDLDDIHCRMAKDAGVLISLATDSHRTAGFANLQFGISQARRGWLTQGDVLNSRPLGELRARLRPTMRA